MIVGTLTAIVLGLASSACTTTGQPTATGSTRGPTVAFESIDGPPESVFHRLVQQISDEAVTRQVAIVSRTETAQYRVRSYVATQTQNKRSTVAWVWDVYDAEQRRTLRISGEEPASAAGTGTWAAADDQVLRRVASAGMDRLVAYLAAPSTETRPNAPAPAPAATPATTIAAGNNDSVLPEAGALASPSPSDDPVPTPRRRPSTTGDRDLAYLDTNR
ncbi:hypothetical protein RA307_15315 [Xanthobacteraceae bacterium Astr-EGSB]|uniref:hypothetical protein n=1 Tax=Astrobacterium formosum TaxID=3069710 RepID=UPI0027B6A765|nr:hypothetical protein [Xanthobacteraceae bacterium Astr-EGSB]